LSKTKKTSTLLVHRTKFGQTSQNGGRIFLGSFSNIAENSIMGKKNFNKYPHNSITGRDCCD